jgi:phosphopantothenoylcysteine decarboxylase / phosphopantothenate---cysteine ligase
MQGKKILIAITGSIAAYKIPELCRLFIKQGAEVQVMMTPSAKDFVSDLVLATLTRKKVLIHMFDEATWSNHVMLGRWADCILIAPASCNTIAKLSNGICDNFLLATCLSATCPILIAPAMDEDMWHHPSTKRNLAQLQQDGCHILPSQFGELASGLVGMGRMMELQDIVTYVENFLNPKQPLLNKQVVITAGPTFENLDPVRFIGNYSSGKMGIAIAERMASLGAKVHLVLGPSKEKAVHKNIVTYKVRSAQEMFSKTTSIFKKCDIAILSAAVADFTPKKVAAQKIKKGADDTLTLELVKTKDILAHVGHNKTVKQCVVGFALESNNEEQYAHKKLKDKKADIIVLNSLNDEGAGFGVDTNKVTIYNKKGAKIEGTLKPKTEVAKDICDHILQYCKLDK